MAFGNLGWYYILQSILISIVGLNLYLIHKKDNLIKIRKSGV